MSQSVLAQKHDREARKQFVLSMLIIPAYAAAVGTLVGAFAALLFQIKPEGILPWAFTGAGTAFVLVAVSCYFMLRPAADEPSHLSAE